MPKKGVIPKQFLSHPPKSWKGDMPKIRQEAKRDLRRADKSRGKNMPRKDRKRRRPAKAVHVVPDAIALMAVAQPLINGQNTGGDTALHYLLTNGGGDVGTTLEGTVWRVQQNIVPAAKSAVVLGAVALGVKFLSKKTGLNRVGTRELKIA